METNIRFFTVAFSEGDADTFEITEDQFKKLHGSISYERHSVFQNGIDQVCLTIESVYYPMAEDLDVIL